MKKDVSEGETELEAIMSMMIKITMMMMMIRLFSCVMHASNKLFQVHRIIMIFVVLIFRSHCCCCSVLMVVLFLNPSAAGRITFLLSSHAINA